MDGIDESCIDENEGSPTPKESMDNPVKKRRRGRSNSTGINNNEIAILSAIRDMKSDLSSQFGKFSDEINGKIDSANKDLTERFNSLSTSVDDRFKQLNSTIVSVATKSVLEKITPIITTVSDAVTSNDLRIDRLEREALMNRLLITGIPFINDENTSEILDKIASHIGFNDDVKMCYTRRITNSNKNRPSTSTSSSDGKSPSAPPILVIFPFVSLRDKFFKLYLHQRNINLRVVGFNVTERIYINDLLTRKQTEIWNLARKLRADKKIQRCYVIRGLVHVVKFNESKAICITSKNELSF